MSRRIPPPSPPIKPIPGGGLSKLSSAPEINHLLGVRVDSAAECSICVLTTERDQLEAERDQLKLAQLGRLDPTKVTDEFIKLEPERDLFHTACKEAAACFRRAIPWSARKPIDAVLAIYAEAHDE